MPSCLCTRRLPAKRYCPGSGHFKGDFIDQSLFFDRVQCQPSNCCPDYWCSDLAALSLCIGTMGHCIKLLSLSTQRILQSPLTSSNRGIWWSLILDSLDRVFNKTLSFLLSISLRSLFTRSSRRLFGLKVRSWSSLTVSRNMKLTWRTKIVRLVVPCVFSLANLPLKNHSGF